MAEAETKKKSASKDAKADDAQNTIWSRREFFSLAGWTGFLASLGLSSLYFARLLFPRVLFEPSPIFKAGYPSDYTVGAVSTKYIKDQRVWIVRDEEGIYVIYGLCTHLGCTPRWLNTESKYKCPCHGSGFTKEGMHFEGPAPRPLERLKIALGPDGQIIVDKSKKFLWEKGQWGDPGSKLLV